VTEGEVQMGRLRRRRRPRRRRERRAIFLLPNLITTANMLLGFWSIAQSFRQEYERAALGIILAGVGDMLDGRIARATRSTTRFGIEYDSLTDMVSFGVAPAVLVYAWMLAPFGPRGWLIASLFAICAALRLARFNVQQHVEQRNRYQGLPSTLAGGFVAVSVWFVGWLGYAPPFGRAAALGLGGAFASLALLMVSSLPYLSLKSVPFSPNSYGVLVTIALALIAILLHPEPAMFAIGLCYVLSGPLLWVWEMRSRRAQARAAAPPAEESLRDVH
jgi:CDP-diacylglycerol--serine O-phosphatidyltransferase